MEGWMKEWRDGGMEGWKLGIEAAALSGLRSKELVGGRARMKALAEPLLPSNWPCICTATTPQTTLSTPSSQDPTQAMLPADSCN